LPPTTNPNWNLGGLKDRPRISFSTKYYMSLGNKRNHQIQVNNNLRKKMVEKKHNTKCWARLLTNCCTLFWRSSLHTCVSTKSSIRLGSRPRVVACKIKMLSVKYIYKKQQIKKVDVIKKKSYHPLRKWNERGASVCSNWTVNLQVPVPHTRLWSSHETLGHHVLNVFCPYSFWDVWQPKILSNCHVIPAL
jgi:hypothetical protein